MLFSDCNVRSAKTFLSGLRQRFFGSCLFARRLFSPPFLLQSPCLSSLCERFLKTASFKGSRILCILGAKKTQGLRRGSCLNAWEHIGWLPCEAQLLQPPTEKCLLFQVSCHPKTQPIRLGRFHSHNLFVITRKASVL